MSLARTGQDDRYHRAEAKAKAAEKIKAIILLIIGIFMLTVLAEPLVESVRKFSESVKIEPFYVSFILVPLATNARTAIAAIRAAKQKRHHTTSLTFSEIYHKVFMNNILGFFVLTSVIYFRGLTWHFSAEILVVIIVCIIMGLLASYKSKLPNWTLLVAFPLYPLSLVVVYFVNDAFQFT
nr:sodium/calcium exchanger NCL2-like [Tanacetum cinerariifolium]